MQDSWRRTRGLEPKSTDRKEKGESAGLTWISKEKRESKRVNRRSRKEEGRESQTKHTEGDNIQGGGQWGESQREKEKELERRLPPATPSQEHLWSMAWHCQTGQGASAHASCLPACVSHRFRAYLIDIASWILCRYLKSTMSTPVPATQFSHHHCSWLSLPLFLQPKHAISAGLSRQAANPFSFPTSTATMLARVSLLVTDCSCSFPFSTWRPEWSSYM